MTTKAHTRFFMLPFLVSFLFLGCTATYPQEKVEESIKLICQKEYAISVDTYRNGLTVYAYAQLNLASPDLKRIDKKTSDSMSDVLNSLSRVVLS
jgi:hypothetical protein